jgi:hypothetical protein
MRAKPAFEANSSGTPRKSEDSSSCSGMIFITLIGVLCSFGYLKSVYGDRLDQVVCIGILICIILAFALNTPIEKMEKKRLQKERQRWMDACTSAEVAILKRDGFPGASYEDEYGIPHRTRAHYSVTLRLPNQTDVNVDVSAGVFAKLSQRDTVRIYYEPASPMTFMLEEELSLQ